MKYLGKIRLCFGMRFEYYSNSILVISQTTHSYLYARCKVETFLRGYGIEVPCLSRVRVHCT